MSEDSKIVQQKERLIHALATMFDYLGLAATFRVEEKQQRLMVKISSEDAGRIIGRKGQTLESLQLLINRIMFKEDETFPRIALDIDGYSDGERERKGGRGNGEKGGNGRRERNRRSNRGGSERGNGGEHFSREELEQLARDKGKEVKRWGDAVKLPELNARDRRIVHMTLKDDPELVTESEGEGAFKKVVISLRGDAAAPVSSSDAE
jgi:spoIIIJ-associated protein